MPPAPVRIRRVADRRDFNDFLHFPHSRYAGDPAWVPPLDAWTRYRLSRFNGFLKKAHLELYLARRGTEVVGRISALRDPHHESHRDDPTGFFGFFESVDDETVARNLLDIVSDRIRQWGLSRLRGPRNLTRVEEQGIQVDGFGEAPPFLASHHPPSYLGFLEGAGFRKHRDLFAYQTALVDGDGRPRPLPEAIGEKAERVNIPGLEIVSGSRRRLGADLEDAYQIFVDAFRALPENTPMPKDQFMGLGRLFLSFFDPRLLQLARVNGRPAGFALCFPEINDVFGPARGHVAPLGWARMLAGTRTKKTASFKLLGVLPEYRDQKLHHRLIRNVVLGTQEAGYQRIDASVIDEGNPRMRHVAESLTMVPYQQWRVFERDL